MGTVMEDMKQVDLGRFFFKAPNPGLDLMSKNFEICKSINDSWMDYLRKSVKERAPENAGPDSQWQKAMEDWRQFPAQVLHHSISSAAAIKEVMQRCVGGQKTYADLGIASLDCLQKMSQAFREARRNGNDASDAWKSCLQAYEEFVGAGMSFAEERVSALYQLWSGIGQKNATAEKREISKAKEGKTSRT